MSFKYSSDRMFGKDAVQAAVNVDELRQYPPDSPNADDIVITLGYQTINDGGGGMWYWDPLSTAPDDGSMVINPRATPTAGKGRWKRLLGHDKVVNARWFGAKGDGVTNDTVALQAWLDAAVAMGIGTLAILPQGTYRHTDLVVTNRINIRGDGMAATTLKALAGTGIMLTIGDGSIYTDGWHEMSIRELTVDGNNLAQNGIYFRNNCGTRALLENIAVTKCIQGTGYGIYNEDAAFSMSWYNVWTRYNKVGIFLVHRIQNSTFFGVRSYGNSISQGIIGDFTASGTGEYLVGDTAWFGCQFEPTSAGASGPALYLNNVSEISLFGCHFEAKTGAIGPAIEIAPVGGPGITNPNATITNITIQACHIRGASVASYAIALPSDTTNVDMTIGGCKFNDLLIKPIKNENHPNKSVNWSAYERSFSTPHLRVTGGFAIGGNGTDNKHSLQADLVGQYNPASSILTLLNQPTDGQTFTIRSRTYTYRTALTGTANEILIGTSIANSLVNAASAINRTATAGTTYTDATARNADVQAYASTNKLTVIALVNGIAGNAYATTSTITNGTWTSTTLTGGVATYDPADLAAMASVSVDVLVFGAATDMWAQASFTAQSSTTKMPMVAAVTAPNVVTCWFLNLAGVNQDLGAGIINVLVWDA